MSTGDLKGGLPRLSGGIGLISAATWARLQALVTSLQVVFDPRVFVVKQSSKGRHVTLRQLDEFIQSVKKTTLSPLELTLSQPAYCSAAGSANTASVWVSMGSVGGAIANNYSDALTFNDQGTAKYYVYVQAELGQSANLHVTSCSFHISSSQPEFYDSWPSTNARPSYVRIVLGFVVVTDGAVSVVSDKGNIHLAEYNVQAGSSFSRRIIFNRG